jgi:Domain of unknown function (DUF4159)/Aerotolerance regulator N-terminal
MTIGALAFLNPWLLAALATLPLIYWLLRTVPPRPQQIAFPATRILVGLENKDKTPAKTPWWLLLIRLLAAALVIAALAEPILNPNRETKLTGTGPVVIAIDNGWASAANFAQRAGAVEQLITQAESQRRPVIILPTAQTAKTATARLEASNDARTTAAAISPQPFAPDRTAAITALETALVNPNGEASIVWLTDGVDQTGDAGAFMERLQKLGRVTLFDQPAADDGLGLIASVGPKGKLEAEIRRTQTGTARDGVLHALSVRNQRLGEAVFRMPVGSASTTVTFELPLELRNQVARVEIASVRSAGSVSLLDTRSQWHRIGLLSGENREQAQALLAPLYYIEKALAPFAEMIKSKDANFAASIDQSLRDQASVLMLADIGTISGDVRDRLDTWVKKGGVLVRFAGPRLEKGGDDLMPVALRLGGRTLGGALSWSTPQALAPFDDTSIFTGLAIPPEVTVTRQVLADPAKLGTNVNVWARLKDGTPLVTAVKRGQGQIVLFHVTANSDWSNLPLSGLFVDMLRRISALGKGIGAGDGDATTTETADGTVAAVSTALAPVQTLDGYGVLKAPPPHAQPAPANTFANLTASAPHPPGYYGSAAAPRALNIIGPKTVLNPLPAIPASVERRGYDGQAATPLKPWLLSLALGLLLIDVLAILALAVGGLRLARIKPAASASALLIALGVTFATVQTTPADAQAPPATGAPKAAKKPISPSVTRSDDETAKRSTSKVTLGYVKTGDSEADDTSRLGLLGLNKILSLRTSIEPGEPAGINIATDEIAFYPVLYWPVLPNAQPLHEAALAKIDAYMKEGGLIIFDTRDYGQGAPTGLSLTGKNGTALQNLLARLDVPRLEPVPEAHVLTKSFYLLKGFPGRYSGGQLWVEASDGDDDSSNQGRKARRADGVTSIMITSNDFAAAWALDERGRPIFPTVPGGENQREMAFRTGVNIVMHALTGNYKADQVHVPALLERLGQ